eukprot:COSAG06_NODE_556_length_14336_cov_8.683290_8_plen_73_part_00
MRTFLEGETLGSCCEKCYLDYEAATGPCEHWAMPDPANSTCIHYSGGAKRSNLFASIVYLKRMDCQDGLQTA